jgi:hypothetical protein
MLDVCIVSRLMDNYTFLDERHCWCVTACVTPSPQCVLITLCEYAKGQLEALPSIIKVVTKEPLARVSKSVKSGLLGVLIITNH